jgi:hypothetical protein
MRPSSVLTSSRLSPLASLGLVAVMLAGPRLAEADPPRTLLGTEPVAQARESPREGWCGEAAIQEGLLSLGAYVSQARVNRAGKPAHPDLYASEIPEALRALGVSGTWMKGRGFDAVRAFTAEAVARGRPVVAGVKLLPTAHPAWGLDHFVVLVGVGDPGIRVDTTWGTRVWVGSGASRGISLDGAFFAVRLEGISALPEGEGAVLSIVSDDASLVVVRAVCPPSAARVRVDDVVPARDVALVSREARVTVKRDAFVRFRCLP